MEFYLVPSLGTRLHRLVIVIKMRIPWTSQKMATQKLLKTLNSVFLWM